MNNEPKKLDTLTKEELIEEYNKLSDFCVDVITKYNKPAADYAEQVFERVKEKAILAHEFQKFKKEMGDNYNLENNKGGNFGNVR